ncbi:MAG: AAA family ATPase, partial [Chlamydiota bacterium]|nr:AAA family ATPase [Chlamydiota bacterium]
MGITGDLFNQDTLAFDVVDKNMPLAARMRPRDMTQFYGQEHLLGVDKELLRIINTDCFTSLIFYGPPGTGKTTLSHLIVRKTQRTFIAVSAVTSNVQEIRRIIDDASRKSRLGIKTALFVDEIHRFNKAQQDLLLPHIEKGTISFIGATTHNPFFSCIAPLVSRSQVFRLKALKSEAIIKILKRALVDVTHGLGKYKVL